MLHNFRDRVKTLGLESRFRGFLPVVIDIETGGIDPSAHAILEIGAVFLRFTEDNRLVPSKEMHYHVVPAKGTLLDKASLEFTQIDPYHPLRLAISETEALQSLFACVEDYASEYKCRRAIVVGHNAWFDLHALLAGAERSQITQVPFHSFSSIDTASLGAVLNGQTVLARLCRDWGVDHDPEQAHSALYDAQITAELFCRMVNAYQYPNQENS